jgi:hypothetical protein
MKFHSNSWDCGRWMTLPAPAKSTPAAQQSHDEEQQYRADRGVDDGADHAGTQMDANPRQQPISDKGTQYSKKDITDDPKTRPSHDLTGQPARNETYEQYDQQAFIRHMHGSPQASCSDKPDLIFDADA